MFAVQQLLRASWLALMYLHGQNAHNTVHCVVSQQQEGGGGGHIHVVWLKNEYKNKSPIISLLYYKMSMLIGGKNKDA